MIDYPTLVDAREALKDFRKEGGPQGFSDELIGLVYVGLAIDRVGDCLEEANRLLTIIATNTE